MLCAIGTSFVFQVLTRPMVGYNRVVSGMVVGVLDSVMDSVLDPNSLWSPAEVEYPIQLVYELSGAIFEGGMAGANPKGRRQAPNGPRRRCPPRDQQFSAKAFVTA